MFFGNGKKNDKTVTIFWLLSKNIYIVKKVSVQNEGIFYLGYKYIFSEMLNFSKIRIPFFYENDENFNLQKYGLRHFLDVRKFCTT